MAKIIIRGYDVTTDVKAPEIKNKQLNTSNITQTGFDVDFNQAIDVDDYSIKSSLIYKLYKSDTNNIGTVSDIENNGIFEESGSGISKLSFSNLIASQSVWFNVTVEDEAGNLSAYNQNFVITATSSISASIFDSTFDTTFV